MEYSVDDLLILFCHIFVAIVVIRLFVGAYRSYYQRVPNTAPADPANMTQGNAPLLSPTSTREEVEVFARQMRNSAANRRAANRHEGTDPNEDECCVCLCEAQAAVEFLRCGHTFCGKCALQLWEHGGLIRQMVCPLDRLPVEAIVPDYRMREHIQRRRRGNTSGEPTLTSQEVSAIDAKLARYNTNNPQRSVRGVLRLAVRSITLARFMPILVQLKIFLLFVLPILYTVSPIDLIPELVFGIVGYIDDVIVIVLALVALAGIARRMLGTPAG
eukprot:GILI01022410.1.p1 GENE.GILI01022410.1~~GILI01022410.1.p1  ORF type:complete len:290 (+),score=23.27 GILI01022410.1:54-872(+)